ADLARLHLHLGVDATLAQVTGDIQRVRQLGFVHQGDHRLHAALGNAVDQPGLAQLPEQPAQADGNAYPRQPRPGVMAGQVLVTATGADRADARVLDQLGLVDGAGVVVQATGDGEVQAVGRFGHAERTYQGQHLAQLARTGAQRLARALAGLCQHFVDTRQRVVVRARAHFHEREDAVHRVGRQAEVRAGERFAHVIHAALVELVDLAQDQRLLLRIDHALGLE